MEGKRFDQLARAMATSDSRRRVLGGFLAGALGGLRIRPSAADDSGTAIADASGGNHNHASAAEQAANGNGQDHDGNGDGGRDHDNANNRNDNKGGGRWAGFGLPLLQRVMLRRKRDVLRPVRREWR